MDIAEWLARQKEQLAAGPRTEKQLAEAAGVSRRIVQRAAAGIPVSRRIAFRLEREMGGMVVVERISRAAKKKKEKGAKRVAIRQ